MDMECDGICLHDIDCRVLAHTLQALDLNSGQHGIRIPAQNVAASQGEERD